MSIIISAIKRNIRDKDTTISTLFLVLILPFIFIMMFSQDEIQKDIKVNIVANEESEVTKAYTQFLDEFKNNNSTINIDYTLNKESEKALDILIDEKNKNIEVKSSNGLNMNEIMVEKLTSQFFEGLSLTEIESIKPISENSIKTLDYKTNNEINEDDINISTYFSLITIEMAILVGGMYVFKSTFYFKENIGKRVNSSPIKTSKLISYELIGSFISIVVQGLILIALAYIVYGVNINTSNIFGISYCIILLSIFSVAIGIVTTTMAGNRKQGDFILSVITMIITFLSGRMMPGIVDSDFGIFNLNPFTKINSAMYNLSVGIVDIDYLGMTTITIGVSFLLVAICSIVLKRKVGK